MVSLILDILHFEHATLEFQFDQTDLPGLIWAAEIFEVVVAVDVEHVSDHFTIVVVLIPVESVVVHPVDVSLGDAAGQMTRSLRLRSAQY